MYTQLLKTIYYKPSIGLINQPASTSSLDNLARLGAFFIVKTSAKPKNHVLFQKITNSVVQWNLYAWGLNVVRLNPHPNKVDIVHKLFFFYHNASENLS